MITLYTKTEHRHLQIPDCFILDDEEIDKLIVVVVGLLSISQFSSFLRNR